MGVNIANLLEIQDEFIKAVWRGVHDSKAALVVDCIQKSVEEGVEILRRASIPCVRTARCGGSGVNVLGLHHAYVDEDIEIPTQIDITELGLEGGLERAFQAN